MKSVVLCIALVAFAGSVVGRSPPVSVIPENCVFLTNTQTATGGQYSYIDPLGSLITITYELGTNGQYTENRKVVLDYAISTSSSGFTSTITSTGVRPSTSYGISPFKPVTTRPITTRPFKPVPTRPVRPVTPVRPIKPVVTVDINTLTNELVEIIVKSLKNDIQTAVLIEIRAHSENDDEVLADAILNTLRSSIIQVITTTVNSNSKFSGFKSDIQSLTTRILKKLRPIILGSIKAGLQKVRQEQAKQGQLAQGQLIDSVIAQISGLIQSEVRAVIQGYSGSLANASQESLIDAIIQRLRPIILSTLKKLQRSDSRFSSISSSSFNSLVDQIVAGLRPLIIQYIEEAFNFRLQASLIEEFITIVIGQLDGDVQSFVLAELKGLRNLDNVNEQRILQAAISKMTPIIRQTIQSLFRSQSRFAVLSSQIDLIIQRIIDALRPILLDAIRFNIGVLRRESIKVVTQPPPKKQQITNLFGISGENNVKVETPKFNYQYAIDFSKRR